VRPDDLVHVAVTADVLDPGRTLSDSTMSAVSEVAGSLVARCEWDLRERDGGRGRCAGGRGRCCKAQDEAGGEARGGGCDRHEQSAPVRPRRRGWGVELVVELGGDGVPHPRWWFWVGGGIGGAVAGDVDGVA
jgi:hypothetical protein